MAKYRTCEYCGDCLDFGEICNCEGSRIARGAPARIDSKEYII